MESSKVWLALTLFSHSCFINSPSVGMKLIKIGIISCTTVCYKRQFVGQVVSKHLDLGSKNEYNNS